MWNRWQDPTTGRFLSEDPARDGNNWYAYVGNNPLTFTDPTGLIFGIDDAIIIGAIVIGAIIGAEYGGAATNDGNLNPFQWDWGSGNTYGGVVVGALIGGIAGGTGSVAAGFGAVGGGVGGLAGALGTNGLLAAGINGAVGGAVGGFITGFGNTWAFGGNDGKLLSGDLGEAFQNGAIGAGYGAIAGGAVGVLGETVSNLVSAGLKNVSVPFKDAAKSSQSINLYDLVSAFDKNFAGRALTIGSRMGSLALQSNSLTLVNIAAFTETNIKDPSYSDDGVSLGLKGSYNALSFFKPAIWNKSARDRIPSFWITGFYFGLDNSY